MELIWDVAFWTGAQVEQLGMWAYTPFVVGAGLVGIKIKSDR
jgi:hypothetical protein